MLWLNSDRHYGLTVAATQLLQRSLEPPRAPPISRFLAKRSLNHFAAITDFGTGGVKMGIYLSSPKTEKVSEDGENDRLRYGLSSMQGWRSTMEDAHAVYPNLDSSTSFFGVYDGHGGDEVSKFCAKFLHQEVLNHEAFSAGDMGTSIQNAFLRMDEMMRGQTGQIELTALAEKDQSKEIIEGLISPPKRGESKGQTDGGSSEEVSVPAFIFCDDL
ncbi:hypothetical protein HAX54_034142 [Datura stramonium]|uniref:protein-serine/threonine phosphatase n=1 Tax=Datura stramonium TaxID=4076 RepID=A0ABS8VEV9_DATST|nr:hypothetical protein [Datura stramonium]